MFEVLFFAGPVVALVLSWTLFSVRRKRFRAVLETVARRQGARVVDGFPLIYSWLDLESEGAQILVTGWKGQGRSGRTVAQVTHADFGPAEFQVERRPRRAGLLEEVGRKVPTTGHAEFDENFRVVGSCDALLASAEVRRALLHFDPSLGVRVRYGNGHVFRGGRIDSTKLVPRLEVSLLALPPTVEQAIELLEATELLKGAFLATSMQRRLVAA